jgi:hypothetical protein
MLTLPLTINNQIIHLLFYRQKCAQNLIKSLIDFSEAFRQQWRSLVVSLIIGLGGALLFIYLTLPLPWLIGPVFATTLAAMIGVKIWMPNPLGMQPVHPISGH